MWGAQVHGSAQHKRPQQRGRKGHSGVMRTHVTGREMEGRDSG